MSRDNYIGKQVEAASLGPKATLDNAVKRVLALKPILARILKGTLQEYAAFPAEEIEKKYIEGSPSIASEAVHESEAVPAITGINTEHSSTTEGTVTFDLKFNAIAPNGKGYSHMIINVEGQNKAAYPILKRGIYYCSRMLAAQYGTVFTKSHYEKLRKVVSIWICFAGKVKEQNTINSYYIRERQLKGKYKAASSHYDLVEVVTLYTGDDLKTDNELLKLLDKLFTDRYNVEEKKRFLEECGIAVTEAVSKEVDNMCNYSDYIEERGEKRGVFATRLADVQSIMKNLNLTAEQAMQALQIPKEEQAELLTLI